MNVLYISNTSKSIQLSIFWSYFNKVISKNDLRQAVMYNLYIGSID